MGAAALRLFYFLDLPAHFIGTHLRCAEEHQGRLLRFASDLEALQPTVEGLEHDPSADDRKRASEHDSERIENALEHADTRRGRQIEMGEDGFVFAVDLRDIGRLRRSPRMSDALRAVPHLAPEGKADQIIRGPG